jgi:hypothetical protein
VAGLCCGHFDAGLAQAGHQLLDRIFWGAVQAPGAASVPGEGRITREGLLERLARRPRSPSPAWHIASIAGWMNEERAAQPPQIGERGSEVAGAIVGWWGARGRGLRS